MVGFDSGLEDIRTRSVSSREKLRGLIARILDNRAPSQSFSDEDTLVDVGVVSIDMVKLLLLIESEFNVEIPSREITADAFKSVSTIDALLERLGAIGVSST
ncbi:MAG: acyl carrier protein [Deltaproteobacteria bacterium]|nr:acyl carrier protein [Deltaproteobacteria bacterium]